MKKVKVKNNIFEAISNRLVHFTREVQPTFIFKQSKKHITESNAQHFTTKRGSRYSKGTRPQAPHLEIWKGKTLSWQATSDPGAAEACNVPEFRIFLSIQATLVCILAYYIQAIFQGLFTTGLSIDDSRNTWSGISILSCRPNVMMEFGASNAKWDAN